MTVARTILEKLAEEAAEDEKAREREGRGSRSGPDGAKRGEPNGGEPKERGRKFVGGAIAEGRAS